jgi:putative flippase GtrA
MKGGRSWQDGSPRSRSGVDGDASSTASHRTGQEERPLSRREILVRQGRALIVAIQANDEAAVEAAVFELSRSRRIFAPLVFGVGAFVMLFQGLRLLFSNWRLTLIQVLPAMWIWVALLDLKVHVFKGKEFHSWHGPAALALVVAIALVTAVSFYLNAVFAFAISQPGTPRIRPAFTLARRHLGVVLAVGLVVGVAFGFSAIVVPRWGRGWFVLSLGIVVWVMMLTYVTIPARIVGIRPTGSRRDRMAAAVIGGTLGALVCTPPYVIGRIGILLLGSDVLFVLGVVVLALGLMLQAGATGAVKAIKMSAKLAAGTASGQEAGSPAAGGA